MNQPVIISAVRTPVGKYMGALKDVEAYDLAALVLNEVSNGALGEARACRAATAICLSGA